MYEDICYDKPFLKEVIARVDFVAPIEPLNRAVPPKLANPISKLFPVREPTDTVTTDLIIGNGMNLQRETRFKQWNFYGKDRGKQLTISPFFFFTTYHKYKNFEQLQNEFSTALEAIGKLYPDTRLSRVGLRYINNIEIDELKSPTQWGDFISRDLLGMEKFISDVQLTRLFHIVEIKREDISLRFQCGMPNPDFPAVIKRPLFVLDFDAYSQTALDIPEAMQHLNTAHEFIQDIFEKSITDTLRERMDVRSTNTLQ